MNVLTEVLQQCEQLLRSGQIRASAKLLRELNTRQIPNEYRLNVAKLCRRSGLIALGLRILSPQVRGVNGSDVSPTAAEQAEFATLLQRSGVFREAINILGKLDARTTPEVDLYMAYTLFSRWQYEESIPFLQRYVSGTSGYAQLLGRVNLAAALVATAQDQLALPFLAEIIHDAKAGGFARLAANAFEMRAEVHLRLSEIGAARNDLSECRQILQDALVPDQLFMQMWTALADSLEAKSGAPLKAFRKEAIARRDWEVVREADLHLLKIKPDVQKHLHLYSGTPFSGYKRRIAREIGLPSEISTSYTWELAEKGPELNLVTGTFGEQRISTMLLKTLCTLASDLYRPQPIGSIFSEVFHNETFDIFTSPNRVHQLVRRSRSLLKEINIPLSIEHEHQTYRLNLIGPGSVVIPQDQPENLSSAQIFIRRVSKSIDPSRPFTSSQLRELLGLEKTQVNNLLADSKREGLVVSIGKGPGTVYRLRSRAA